MNMENVSIQNGDMITMARLVNHNTIKLHEEVQNIKKTNDVRMSNLVGDINGVFKIINKNFKKICIGFVLIDVAVMVNNARITKLEKKVQQLEDELTVAKFLNDDKKKDEDDDFSFLK